MATDEERREVARMAELNADSGAQFWKFNVARAMGMNGKESDASMWHRIADLIEPDTTTDTTKDVPASPIASPIVDRDALIKIADAMERKAFNWDMSSDDVPLVHAGYLLGYADRIREALGVGHADE